MTFSQLIVVLILVFFVGILILFPQFRAKLKTLLGGFLNIWVEDKAKTPEGARAIYAQAIEEAQDQYNSANDAYRRLYGQLNNMKNKKADVEAKRKECEKACENLVKAGKMDAADIKAEEREDLIRQANLYTKAISELEPRVQDAAQINTECEKRLKTLKQKSKEVVEGLEMNRQLQDIYDEFDELKKTTSTSKLLDCVHDAYEDSQNSVAGARAVHENKISTKAAKANAEADKVATNDYLEQLKKQYSK